MPLCSCEYYYSARKYTSCPKCGTPLAGHSNQSTTEKKIKRPLSFGMPKVNDEAPKTLTETTRRPCPHCTEMVMESAKICPYCKRAILSFDPSTNAMQSLVLSGISFAVLFFGTTYCARWETENVTMPWAERQAEQLMRDAEIRYKYK